MDKLNKSFMVEILKKFEKDLKTKFNLRKMGKDRKIYHFCSLCKFYCKSSYNCRNCPFARFEIFNLSLGCFRWKKMITGKHAGFHLATENYFTVTNVEEFKVWRKIATKYIKFV